LPEARRTGLVSCLLYLLVMDEQRIDQEPEAQLPSERALPITNRFLFVDVAALRAKQLRRGARLRLGERDTVRTIHKTEWLAMEEVRSGLVSYFHVPTTGEATA